MNAVAKDQITWANLHFPPWMILDGKFAGQGVWDELLEVLIVKLPEYEHVKLVMNNARYNTMAVDQKNVCKVYYYKTPEREKILYYSIPSVVFLANNIVIRRDKALSLGNTSSYSLEKLMKSSNFNLTVIAARSYGKTIDRLIKTHSSLENISTLPMNNKQLFLFLDRGRTDYILELPAGISFFEQELGIKSDTVNISIEESITYNITYVTCVKNAWGRKIIDRVNDILVEYLRTKRHREATLRWHNTTDRQQLSEIFDEILIKGTSK